MAKLCVNQTCKKELPEDAVFCGFCKTEQRNDTEEPEYNTNTSLQIFYAEDYELVRQFDPVITPTKEQVSFNNLLTRFQEAVASKNYPFSVEKKEQSWRTEGGKGKQRIVIQPTHDEKWQKTMFSIAVDQMGNDTTIKLNVFRKNEMAEFYFTTMEEIGVFSPNMKVDGPNFINLTDLAFSELKLNLSMPDHFDLFKKRLFYFSNAISGNVSATDQIWWTPVLSFLHQLFPDSTKELPYLRNEAKKLAEDLCFSSQITNKMVNFNINWQDPKRYTPDIDQSLRLFAEKIEGIMALLDPEEVKKTSDVKPSFKNFIVNLLNAKPQFKDYKKNLCEQHEKEKIISAEIIELQSDLAQMSFKVEAINREIKSAEDSLRSFEGLKVIAIIIAIAFFIFSVSSLGFMSFIISVGIYVFWAIGRGMKSGTLTSLRSTDLINAQEKYNKINVNIYQKNGELSKVGEIIITDRNSLITAISELKHQKFQYASQQELKWREPSFVDEELEQLISVIKNLFNQTIGKLTEKKEMRDVKLQSTLGLGGMGFE